MAVVTKFVDFTSGNDSNDGLDNIGVALTTATWTESTFTLTQAGHGYTFATGDVIALTGGTGVTTGVYEVASSTSSTIVLVETSTLPRIGNASDVAAGDLASADITSSDGELKSLDACMNAMVNADDTTFYCRNTATYTGAWSLDTAVSSATQTCTFEGYGTSVGDNSKITSTGVLTDAVATRVNYCFKNILFDAADTLTNCVSFGSYEIMWRNCDFINATSNNITTAQANWFWNCTFTGSGGDGVACGAMGCFFMCTFSDNVLSGIDCGGQLVCFSCIFFSNGGIAADGGPANEHHVILINCTIDGDSKDTTTGILKPSSNRGMCAVINTIIYDCATGIESHKDERDLFLNNLMNSNTSDFAGSASDQESTHITSAPDFVNEGTDFALNTSSPAKGAGTDQSNNIDIGAHQLSGAGGAAGMLRHPGTEGGANG